MMGSYGPEFDNDRYLHPDLDGSKPWDYQEPYLKDMMGYLDRPYATPSLLERLSDMLPWNRINDKG